MVWLWRSWVRGGVVAAVVAVLAVVGCWWRGRGGVRNTMLFSPVSIQKIKRSETKGGPRRERKTLTSTTSSSTLPLLPNPSNGHHLPKGLIRTPNPIPPSPNPPPPLSIPPPETTHHNSHFWRSLKPGVLRPARSRSWRRDSDSWGAEWWWCGVGRSRGIVDWRRRVERRWESWAWVAEWSWLRVWRV